MDESDPAVVGITGLALGIAFFVGIVLLMCRRNLANCCYNSSAEDGKLYPPTTYNVRSSIVNTEQVAEPSTPPLVVKFPSLSTEAASLSVKHSRPFSYADAASPPMITPQSQRKHSV